MVTFVTTLRNDGNYKLGTDADFKATGYSGEVPETLIIPHVYQQKTIVEVGRFAFFRISSKYLYVEEGIVSLNFSAFRNASIISVTLPSSLKTIDTCTFDDDISLENVYINQPSSLETIGSAAFSTCQKLKEIVIPSSIKAVYSLAFNQIQTNLKVYYCGKNAYIDNTIFNETENVEIIVPRFGIRKFGGRPTKFGLTPCQITYFPQTCQYPKGIIHKFHFFLIFMSID